MACRGVFFSISSDEEQKLRSAKSDDSQVMDIIEGIEEKWDEEHLCQTDKAWDAMHRCLSDGSLNINNGIYPLNHCVLGGEHFHKNSSYIVSYVNSDQVKDIAKAMIP